MEPMRRPGDPTKAESSRTVRCSRYVGRNPVDLPGAIRTDQRAIVHCPCMQASTIESALFGVTLHWDSKSIHEFVQVANTEDIAERIPVWMSQPQGQITEQVFKSDVMAYQNVVAGGLARDNDLAPNTFKQKLNITKRFGYIEIEPFMQACMAKLATDAYLAAVLVRHEGPGFGAQPACLEPPPKPKRQVFL